MSFLSGLGARLGIGGHGGKLPPGNGEWAQLANFFPDDGAGTKKDDKGRHVDVASILGVLGSLGGGQQAPQQQPPPPDWLPIPPPRMLGTLQSAPRLGQGQMMPAPAQMAPYLWGPR